MWVCLCNGCSAVFVWTLWGVWCGYVLGVVQIFLLLAYCARTYPHQTFYKTSLNTARWMTLLKPLNNPNMPIPYEQYYIQTLYREGKLIPEQSPGEINPLFQTVINPQPAHTTWTGQLCFSLQHGHYSNPAAPNLHTRWIEVRTISNSYNKAH